MSTDSPSRTDQTVSTGSLPQDDAMQRNIAGRRRIGAAWRIAFLSALLIGIVALATLLADVVDGAFGYVVYQYSIDPATLADRPLAELSKDELVAIFQANVSRGLYRRYDRERPFAERTQAEVLALVQERVVEEKIVRSYDLLESLTGRAAIAAEAAERFPIAGSRSARG